MKTLIFSGGTLGFRRLLLCCCLGVQIYEAIIMIADYYLIMITLAILGAAWIILKP